jgi:hypothetical protein
MLVLMSILLAACASSPISDRSPLLGMVYNTDRLPVNDVTVRLIHGNQELQRTLTDIRGRFNLSSVQFGPVTLEFTKDGYEPVVWPLRFQGPSQVVYMKLENSDELLAEAGDAVEKRDWVAASGFLDRVEKLVPHSKVTAYLRGIMLSDQGKPAEAASFLEELSGGGSASFALELTLADLYQYKLADPAKALQHLKRALELKRDVDVEKRITEFSTGAPAP